MGKKVKKLVSKFDIGGQLLHKAGLPDPLGDATGLGPGAVAAAEAAEKAAQAGSTVAAPAAAPTAVSEDTQAAREAQRRRQLAAAGMTGTQLTGSYGLQSGANTSMKSLLGS